MAAGGELALEEMKLPQLKEELAAQGAPRVGLKAVLQRRLHGLLVQAAIEARGREEGAKMDDVPGTAPRQRRNPRSTKRARRGASA